MVEYSECLKSWVSIPSGKDRPLLAGVFRSAEEVDKAFSGALEDDPVAVDDAWGVTILEEDAYMHM